MNIFDTVYVIKCFLIILKICIFQAFFPHTFQIYCEVLVSTEGRAETYHSNFDQDCPGGEIRRTWIQLSYLQPIQTSLDF